MKRSWIFTNIIISILSLGISSFVFAASDISFEAARKLAFNGEKPKAREMCLELLKADPNDSEVRTLLGRIYAWDDQYDEARAELNIVLKKNPKNSDARSALIDVEVWSDHPQAALEQIQQGLSLDAKDESLRIRKEKILKCLRLYGFSMSYSQDSFDRTFDDWKSLSVSLSRKFGFGSAIARMNQANRFGSEGTQFEVDAYPGLWKNAYLYLNVGSSNSSIFPHWRFGAEVYQSLGQGWEVSLGLRHLIFQNSVVNIQTGTIGKYLGNYYFLLRLNTVPDNLGRSESFGLQMRRYLGDSDYLALGLGSGRSVSQLSSVDPVFVLGSKRISIDGVHVLNDDWTLNASIGYEDEEIRAGTSRLRTSFSLGAQKTF